MQPSPKPPAQRSSHRRAKRARAYLGLATCAAVFMSGVAVAGCARTSDPPQQVHSTQPVRYLGVYEPDSPGSYTGIDQFAQAIGSNPNLVTYYSPWLQPFQGAFATSAAQRGATVLVQMDATNINLAAIASGQYDAYLRSYASAVKAFGGQVILSFGHEMNGNWYTWGYQHTSATVFVAAWRHIVTVFRTLGTRNVTWLWTVNIIDTLDNRIPVPAPWWPGSSYVNWVGIDGYYYSPSWTFASLFGPTIVAVRELTRDPILISETGAAPSAGQPAKITDLFAGVQMYGLLGFVWYDADDPHHVLLDWRISDPEAFAAYRRDTRAFMRLPATPASPQQRPTSVRSAS
jgi:mannan endo-1,4-beta-mannosidase